MRAARVDGLIVDDSQLAHVIREVVRGMCDWPATIDAQAKRCCISRGLSRAPREISVSHLQNETFEASKPLTSLSSAMMRSVVDRLLSFLLRCAVCALGCPAALATSSTRRFSVTSKPAPCVSRGAATGLLMATRGRLTCALCRMYSLERASPASYFSQTLATSCRSRCYYLVIWNVEALGGDLM